MVPADEVVRVLDRLEQDALAAWLDGGWGVDALVGRQTRPHKDVDIAGTGVVNGRPVRCLSPSLQLKFHQGYELDDDRHDITLLQRMV